MRARMPWPPDSRKPCSWRVLRLEGLFTGASAVITGVLRLLG